MQHMGQKHRGLTLLEDRVGQLRCLDRAACTACGTIRSQRCRRCNLCGRDTPLRELRVGDTFQDRRQPRHQNAVASGTAAGQQLPQSSQPGSPGEPLFRTAPPGTSERDTQLLIELRRAAAKALSRCVVSGYAAAWAESLEGSMSGHQSWAVLCHYRYRLLLAEIPKGVDRNSGLKQRLQLWKTEAAKLWAASQNSKNRAVTDRRKRGKRACALTARGSISRAMKGLVGGAAQGSADCCRNWTTALVPRSSVSFLLSGSR